MKTVKWHTGVKNMVSKRDAKKSIDDLMPDGDMFCATRANFTLLATRAKIGGWKKAVDAIVNKSDKDFAYKNITNGEAFLLNKTELRRAADLL